MKNNLFIVLGIILFLSAGIYSIAWFIAIPKTARALAPYRWKNLSLGEKRNDYHMYLGQPLRDTLLSADDKWIIKRDNYEFNLNIHYGTDSIAKSYVLTYNFKNTLFKRSEVIIADTLP